LGGAQPVTEGIEFGSFFVITPLPSLRFRSLRAFVDGTMDLLLDEAWTLARAEHAMLAAWIKATPAARKNYRPREIDSLIEYYYHLDLLLHRCQDGYSSAHGYAALLSEQAMKQWDQNAQRPAN
jgi:hypothetical protein